MPLWPPESYAPLVHFMNERTISRLTKVRCKVPELPTGQGKCRLGFGGVCSDVSQTVLAYLTEER
jgi:hypothetical protein